MKKRAAVLLCAALFLLLLPEREAAAEEKLTFISINELLPPELVNAVVVDRGGVVYVPCTVFSDYGLNFTYTYFAGRSTAYLAMGDRQMFFELNTGDTYDGDNFHYSISALVWNGTVYLPIAMVYRYFGGFTYNTIPGNEYGDILRLKTDAVVLSDADFLKAAGSAMRIYYEDYYSARTPASAPSPTPSPSPTPEENHEGDQASLSFVGLPGAEILNALSLEGLLPCFFLTAEEVRQAPDLVRRLAGEGYGLGVYCTEDPRAQWRETAGLMFEAAWARPILVAFPAGAEAELEPLAREAGLICCSCDISAGSREEGMLPPAFLPLRLEQSEGSLALRLDCGEESAAALPGLLQYLITQRYEIVPLRETA